MPYKTSNFKVIAIDGPAGSGKSTVARILAKRLGFFYVDTGAMYRAITYKFIQKNLSLEDKSEIIRLAKNSQILLKNTSKGLKVYLDGKDVTEDIRNPEITKYVSEISAIPQVRREMLVQQRKIALRRNCVVEGRDIGTVVFPKAFKKFYIDADFSERVKRRLRELKERDKNLTLKQIEDDLKKRDKIDSSRECAPLRKADDAIYIDTTHMTIEEVVDEMLSKIRNQ